MENALKIALIQAPLVWEVPETNRMVFAKKIAEVSTDVDVVVLPEMFTTGFTMSPNHIPIAEDALTLTWMKGMAKQYQSVIAGSIVYREDGKSFNRFLWVTPEGDVHSYDKKHTFTLAGEHKNYTAGNNVQLISYKGFKICPFICYDLRFPVWSRNTTDYDIALYVANWPNTRVAAWDTLLKARAIENMAYCIGVNRVGTDANGLQYSGHSAVYDPLGEQIVFSDQEEILEVTLHKNHVLATRQKLGFLNDKDAFSFLA